MKRDKATRALMKWKPSSRWYDVFDDEEFFVTPQFVIAKRLLVETECMICPEGPPSSVASLVAKLTADDMEPIEWLASDDADLVVHKDDQRYYPFRVHGEIGAVDVRVFDPIDALMPFDVWAWCANHNGQKARSPQVWSDENDRMLAIVMPIRSVGEVADFLTGTAS